MAVTVRVAKSSTLAPVALPPLAAEKRWFEEQGVNFGIVNGPEVVQRPIPFDPIPRQISKLEWAGLERGLLQRVLALDEFVRDVFDGQRILRAGRIPAAAVYGSPAFLRYASGPVARKPGQVTVAGIDLVKVGGGWTVLEDNLRVPSGVAYALAARRAMLDLHRDDTSKYAPRPISDYPRRLRAALDQRAPGDGLVVVLSPGPYNAAFYEHRELAREMGSPPFEPILEHPWDDDSLAFNPTIEFTTASPRVPRLRAVDQLLDECGVGYRDAESLMRVNQTLRERFAYVPGSTSVGTGLPEVLDRRVGVCQDFAHVMLALARQAGWPARYVSGYLLPERLDEVAESHAWVEVATPDGRWIGLDPTHGVAGHR